MELSSAIDVQIRPAVRADCRTVAGFYRISSDGVADYIWSTLAEPGEAFLDVGQRRYEQEDSAFSYRNCTLATSGNEIVGMLCAFPLHREPAARDDVLDPVLMPYRELEEDNSYYICGMAVLPAHRNKGIGTRFMSVAEDKAKLLGYCKLSLVVFAENSAAQRLYARHDYAEVARARVVPHPLIRVTGDALLMVKHL